MINEHKAYLGTNDISLFGPASLYPSPVPMLVFPPFVRLVVVCAVVSLGDETCNNENRKTKNEHVKTLPAIIPASGAQMTTRMHVA